MFLKEADESLFASYAPETSLGGKVDGNTEAANAGWFRSDVEGANQGTLLQNRAGFAQASRVRAIADG